MKKTAHVKLVSQLKPVAPAQTNLQIKLDFITALFSRGESLASSKPWGIYFRP
ncbi:MAG: hypothetical protein KJ052_05515 [Candidatus Hydrogenedentes bacterium]|nr:hypothetical protein [Candidatus Hydrogenedentota bacterium]